MNDLTPKTIDIIEYVASLYNTDDIVEIFSHVNTAAVLMAYQMFEGDEKQFKDYAKSHFQTWIDSYQHIRKAIHDDTDSE
jgi:hypothetical protein